MAASRRSQYDKRMHAVIEHIDRHLEQDLDLATLATVAHFSAFHFHRIFRVWTGEVLGDYLRRRRLEVAAIRLLAQLKVPVLQIALGVGFGSAEAFARAFRSRFGCSPTQWRNRKRDQAVRKTDQAVKSTQRKNGGSRKPENDMNVKLVEREPVQVASLRHTGPYGPRLSKFWKESVAPWMAT
ncbi:MAG TPA: AraC family transcriptional regulator, partial [Steroidobacteraceae bacterium]|nr:AraC family transcriptional regulator [Steroidobacteraceae bacterium]